MSSSEHPVAQGLYRRVGGATRLLATVMLLPLLDGVFAAVVLAGGLSTVTGIVEVGLLVFGGSATLAVILSEVEDDRRAAVLSILPVGAVVVVGAVAVAAIAPTFRSVLDLLVFERFAAIIILAIAGRTASARIGEMLPRPSMILLLGFVASVDVGGAALVVQADPGLMARAAAAAGIGVAFALTAAVGAPWLRAVVDVERFRFGSAVALGVLPFSILGYTGGAPLSLVVLAVTALLAYDPGGSAAASSTPDDDAGAVADGGGAVAATEDGDEDDGEADEDDGDESVSERVSEYVKTESERAPWM